MKTTLIVSISISILAASVAFAAVKDASGPKEASGPNVHWSYSGAEGPENCGNLSSAYALCDTGTQQSPINIEHTQQAGLASIKIDYKAVALSIVNNGHTLQVNIPPCTEGVQWHVAKTPVEASAAQISQFNNLIGDNARPVQEIGNRLLIDSASSDGSTH